MKKLYFLFFTFLISTYSFGQQVIITGVMDGPCSGGEPKVVEIYVEGTIDFTTTDYQLVLRSNANAWDNMSGVSLSGLGTLTDQFAYLLGTGDTPEFTGDFAALSGETILELSEVGSNGDDSYRIVDSSFNTVDQYGGDTDGTGETWEFLDSWAVRINGTGPDASGFVESNWTIGGANDLDNDGLCNAASALSTIVPFGTYSTTPSSCGVSLGAVTYTCNANTTGTDSVTINISYTGSDADITSVTTSSSGTVGGDNPASVANGTITISGLSEGDAWDITINASGDCDGITTSATVSAIECLPSACIDLTGPNEFEIVQITANSDLDNWSLSSGEYSINGFCGGGCTEATDSWLVFGPLNFSSATDVGLILTATEGFSGSDLGVYYTDAYSGCPDSSVTTWTSIQTIASGSSGDHSLSIPSTGSSVYIGIQYSDSDGSYSSWTLSDVGIYATSCPVLGSLVPSDCSALSTKDNLIEGFSLYPNPTSLGYVNIKSKSNTALTVSVFDVLGKQVLNETIANEQLNVSNLKSGIYIMKVSQDDATVTKKLVIR